MRAAQLALIPLEGSDAGTLTIGAIKTRPDLVPMPMPRHARAVHEEITPREITVRLFSDATNQICLPRSRRPKIESGMFSQTVVRTQQRADIEFAAQQVLSPIFRQIIDDPAATTGRMIRIDVTQPHPYDEMNLAAPSYTRIVPSTQAALGKFHDELIDHIIVSAARRLNPCPRF